MEILKPEKNTVVEHFKDNNIVVSSALTSQALIQLKTEYCTKNKCLHCEIGSAVLNRNM